MSNRPLKLAMLGLGTVGTGVARLLTLRPEHLSALGIPPIELKWVMVRSRERARSVDLGQTQLTDSIDPILNDPEVEIVIEVMGGTVPTRDYIERILQRGKHVVTANKAVLAEHGRELFEVAQENDRAILFEASVAGGVPILAAVAETLSVNRIQSISGIVNGTCNYILSAMRDRGLSYEEALRQAQELGFAEADPTMDVDGSDSAQKLAILARLAFQSLVDWKSIPRRGIDTLNMLDVSYARELGYVIKLLAEGHATQDGLVLHVGPTLVHESHPLAQVRGEYNSIRVVGDAVGDLLFSGKGAGMMPTAASVVAGVIDLATGRGQQTFRSLRLWDRHPPGPRFSPSADGRSRYYLRYSISDRPGVLSSIAGILGEHGISIASVIQHETPEGETGSYVPLVIMTHEAPSRAIHEALAKTDLSASVRPSSVWLPVAST